MKPTHLANMVLRGLLPFQPELRRLKRRLRPYADDPGNSALCITQGLEQVAALRQAGVPIAGSSVLEFGSGWLPLIPMLFHMAGADRLVLTDVERLMDDRTLEIARGRITARLDEIAVVLEQPRETLRMRLDSFAPEYRVPWDTAAEAAASVDLIISRATFEHVPERDLSLFLRDFHRILRDEGAMCHIVDNSDHWQHKDRSLSRVDFLRYDDDAIVWRLAQINTQAFQNRLRHNDYLVLLAKAGFDAMLADGTPDPICVSDLQRLPLAARFRDYSYDDLAVLTSLFVVVKRTREAT
ncbi:class I SAM-dependent methyltransferase [Elioraea sp.]|uniref:class I SAM-dependent methyltransferase n=1 Tax=Elioraea sp. TaxID=2185103 RepID=UPI0025BDB8C5|nr:class I SAM-dependent methyltransferase [Elioraea sp.]